MVNDSQTATRVRKEVASFDAAHVHAVLTSAHGSSVRDRSACAPLTLARANGYAAHLVLDAAERVVADLGVAGDAPSGVTEDAGLVAHDDYFRIRRVAGPNASATYLRTVVRADALLMRELIDGGSSLAPSQVRDIESAFETMRAFALDVEPAPVPVRTWPTPGPRPSAMRRWIRGHQIFTLLTQGLLIAVDDVARTIDTDALAPAVDHFVALMNGSAGSLRLTGDFSSEEYVAAIRPTMTPPNVPEGFSGLLSSDHRALIARIRQLRPVWDRIATEAPAEHERISRAIAYVYDEHKHVCAHFVGTERSSLVASAKPAGKSGVAQLEHFKSSRLRLVGAGTAVEAR